MQRYFIKEKHDNNLILFDQDIYHIKKVMRSKINDQFEAVSNEIVYLCTITNLEPFNFKIIKEYQEERNNKVSLTIAISLVQEQKFDLIIQKLTELGVSKIIPVKTERSIVKLDESKIDKKIKRWQTICKEASEQSHRTNIPLITKPVSLAELTQEQTKLKLICSLNETTKPLNKYLTNNVKEILFIIGPEGGFSQKEEEYLLSNSFNSVSLGKRVLRVETAAIYVASIINYIYEG